MSNFFLKLLLCPGVVFLADALLPGIDLAGSWQIIYTGIFLGILGALLDLLLLGLVESAFSAVVDGVTGALFLYLLPYVFPFARVTIPGALLGGILLGVGEYLLHRLVLAEERYKRRAV